MEDFADSARLAQLHASVVNKRFGIVTALIEEPENKIAPGLFVFNGITVEGGYFRANRSTGHGEAINGSGAAFDRASAMWATLGEAIERYVCCIFLPDSAIRATQAQLGAHAVPFSDYVLFTDAQYADASFRYAPPDPHRPLRWIECAELSDGGRPRYIAANTIYLNVTGTRGERDFLQSVSTGFSCGSSIDHVVRGGLCEVIERDAFAGFWQLRYAAPRLIVTAETMRHLAPGLQAILAHPDIKVTLWDISTDTGIPVILAMAENAREGLVTFGASANTNLVRAVGKAAIECLHSLVWGRRVKNMRTRLPEPADIDSPRQHFSYYLRPENKKKLDFVLSGTRTITTEQLAQRPERQVADVIAGLKTLGYSTYFADASTDDVTSLGLIVGKVSVPGLQPLNFGINTMSERRERLDKIARYWAIDPPAELNRDPHPFP